MIETILVAHGRLAQEMKNSAEMIFGQLPNFQAIEFLKEEGLDSVQGKIQAAVANCDGPVLILTDLFCGTPYNAGCSVHMQSEREMEVMSGMSLPLVLEAATMCPSAKLSEIVEHLMAIPQDTVKAFSKTMIEEEEEL